MTDLIHKLKDAAERAEEALADQGEHPLFQFLTLASPANIKALIERVERAEAACVAAREGLQVAAGWARSKPDSQRARDKIRGALDAIRHALNPAKSARQALESQP